MPFPIQPLRNLSANVFGFPDPTEILRSETYEDDDGYERNRDLPPVDTVSRGQALSAEEEIRANQAGYRATAKRFLPHDVTVLPSDRLRVNGSEYEVLSVDSETSGAFRAHTEVLCRKTS